jgi:hypothetical protein
VTTGEEDGKRVYTAGKGENQTGLRKLKVVRSLERRRRRRW